MSLKEIFVSNLRNARKAAGLSQLRLAERCNTALNYIGAIEAGKRFPSVDMIEKLSDALHVQPYLFFLDSNKLWSKPRGTRLPEMDKADILRQTNRALEKILKKF